MVGVHSAIRGLPVVRPRPIQLLAQLTHQFPLRPGQAVIVDGDGEHAFVMPAIALYLIRTPARAAVAFRMPPHPKPPFVSIAQRRMAMASASLSSAGENPLAFAAAIIASFGALPLPVAWRLMVPTGTP